MPYFIQNLQWKNVSDLQKLSDELLFIRFCWFFVLTQSVLNKFLLFSCPLDFLYHSLFCFNSILHVLLEVHRYCIFLDVSLREIFISVTNSCWKLFLYNSKGLRFWETQKFTWFFLGRGVWLLSLIFREKTLNDGLFLLNHSHLVSIWKLTFLIWYFSSEFFFILFKFVGLLSV